MPQELNQLPVDQQNAIAAAGIDWAKIKGLPWGQILALIQLLINQLASAPGTPGVPAE